MKKIVGGLLLLSALLAGIVSIPTLTTSNYQLASIGEGFSSLVEIFRLKYTEQSLALIMIPKNLGQSIRFRGVSLETTTLAINGPSAQYFLTITNSKTAVSNVFVQSRVEQSKVKVSSAPSLVLCNTSSTPGLLPAGTCQTSFPVSAIASGTSTATLKPGRATAVIEIVYNNQVVAKRSNSIQLVSPSTTPSSTPTRQATVMISAEPVPASNQLIMGSVENSLATFRFSETSNIEEVRLHDLTITDIVSSTTSVKPSFANLLLYSSTGTLLARQMGAGVASGNGYRYRFSFITPLTIPRLGSASLILRGDVPSYSTGAATDNSRHLFSITSSSDAFIRSAVHGASSSVRLSSPNGNTMTVLRNKLAVTSSPIGSISFRSRTVNDDLATLNFSTDAGGDSDVVVNSVTLNISGSGANSSTLASIQLLDQDATPAWDGATVAAVTSSSVRFTITNGVVSRSGRTIKVRLNSTNINDRSGQSDSLSLTLNNSNDIQYTTALSGGVSGVGLSVLAVPLTITSITYE